MVMMKSSSNFVLTFYIVYTLTFYLVEEEKYRSRVFTSLIFTFLGSINKHRIHIPL